VKPVLYAEDERDDVFFMRYAWELAGIPNPLIDVQDGQEAIDYLAGKGRFSDREKHPLPCLLLLDLNLPGQNGFEVLRWVRQQPELKSLKVVIVSGSNQETDIKTARGLGITDYIVKPSTPNSLVEIIQEKRGLWLPKEKE
jgi:CheY-like chemotaxis protein